MLINISSPYKLAANVRPTNNNLSTITHYQSLLMSCHSVPIRLPHLLRRDYVDYMEVSSETKQWAFTRFCRHNAEQVLADGDSAFDKRQLMSSPFAVCCAQACIPLILIRFSVL